MFSAVSSMEGVPWPVPVATSPLPVFENQPAPMPRSSEPQPM
jgi:hypothetical protein